MEKTEVKSAYDIEREKEQKDRDIIRKKLVKVAEALGFTVNKEHGRDSWDNLVKGDKGDVTIFLSLSRYSKGKIHVSAGTPRRPDGGWYGGYLRDAKGNPVNEPSINVSFDKDIETIVTNIKRRFIPDCETYTTLVIERIKRDIDYENKTRTTLEDVSGEKNDDANKNRSSTYLTLPSPIHGTVKAHGNSVNLELSGLPSALAKTIIELVRKETPKED